MVLTRGQVRARRYFGEYSATSSSDSEVSFNPQWLDTVLLGRHSGEPGHIEGDEGQQTDAMASDHQERRIQLLESAVMGMTEKFDELLSVINPDPAPRTSLESARATTPVGNMVASRIPPGHHCDEARPPHLNPRAAGCSDFVERRAALTSSCGGLL